jgi:enoyl-CoA hydratase/3-hydroxyacyl-CoA dehydrogenase
MAQRRLRLDPAERTMSREPSFIMKTEARHPLRALAVVGAGNMGSGIAQKMASEGFHVTIADVDDAKVARGLDIIERTLHEGVARGVFTTDQAADSMARIRATSRIEDLGDADLIVEAVFEDFDVKKDVFQRLDQVCRPDAILATNTSSYSVTALAAVTRRPERVLGLHYFYHPAKNRLVEVVAGAMTDPDAVQRAWTLQEVQGKTPIASSDSYGFIVNRFFAPWLIEAVRILEEGVADVPTIEAAATHGFGIGMGPFALMNVTGLPIALHTATTLGRAFGPMYAAPDVLRTQVESGASWSLAGDPDASRLELVANRLSAVTFYVASVLVDEGVGTLEDTDIGARVGLRWRRGPFELMNHQGIDRAMSLVADFAAKWNLPVPQTLVQQARTARPFRFKLVTSDTTDGIATLTMNRPDALNALNEAVVEQLRTAFRAAVANPAVKGIVIAGSGKAFVAGADIRFFVRNLESGDLERIRAFTKAGQELLQEISACAKPVVARIHGLALGGGVELALACHHIVATPKAALAFPETGIGIYPGLGGTQRTTRRVGKGLAKWLVLTGQTVDADEALAIGLIDRVVPHEELRAAVAEAIGNGAVPSRSPHPVPGTHRQLAELFARSDADALRHGVETHEDERVASSVRRLATKAPVALRVAAELIDRGADRPLEEGLQMELERLDAIFSTRDAYEGLSSLGRRAPVFEGR